MTDMSKKNVAVIGSGVSGPTAAYILRQQHDVTVFEADDRFGGHAHTHTVTDPDRSHRVDSGFIVHNDRTYPHLRRLFAELDVDVHATEMSMSIACEGCGLEFAGGRGGKGIFAQKRRLLDPRYIRMLLGVKRFGRLAMELLDSPESATEPQTYGDFLKLHGFDEYFLSHYAIPVVSCVWSSGHETALAYPARYLFTFLKHHGFLSIKGSPQWYTVVGGSHSYIDKVDRLASATSVKRTADQQVARTADGRRADRRQRRRHHADAVVIATHADEPWRCWPTPPTTRAACWAPSSTPRNETVLHRDDSRAPRCARPARPGTTGWTRCAERTRSPRSPTG